MDIRNIAIIAHVDHGKTTLVDAILKQSHIFRSNQKEMTQNLLMDSNELEKEKGITILAKNTSIIYNNNKINIIDTPGHADFGSEVERVLNMAGGALLLIDAAEGPLPQTRFVLKKALEAKLKLIVVVNKIDKQDARPKEVLRDVENLFLEQAEHDEALDFVTLYGVGRDGKIFDTLPQAYSSTLEGDITPLLDAVIEHIPNSHIHTEKPLQMLISTLDYDPYVGKICIGRISQGTLTKGSPIALVNSQGKIGTYTVTKLFTNIGLERKETLEVVSGDIASIAGIPEMTIGQTITDPAYLHPLETISIEEPTLRIRIGPNSSPFAGKEGEFVTSRQIGERLHKEIETNLGLRLEESNQTTSYIVSGRGQLHLAILIETMAREGFELEVSKPEVIFKYIDGVVCEPFEEVTIDIPKEHIGVVTEEIGKRKGKLINVINSSDTIMRLVYKISSRNLIGIRSLLLTKTKGLAVLNTFLLGYEPLGTPKQTTRNGGIVSTHTGETVTYGLVSAQARGTLFIGPGINVYEGMIVGLSSHDRDVEINVTKSKKLTNNRSSGEGVKAVLEPPTELSLEQYLDIIADDEMLEITPKNLRLRKQFLTLSQRKRQKRGNKETVRE